MRILWQALCLKLEDLTVADSYTSQQQEDLQNWKVNQENRLNNSALRRLTFSTKWKVVVSWFLGILILAAMVSIPAIYYRSIFAYQKRFHIIREGKIFRSGQLTEEGFREVINRYGIRTILNLQEEAQDPILYHNNFKKSSLRESELCGQLGVDYLFIEFDLLPRNRIPEERPAVIDELLQILDNPKSYPLLFHCKAGLHRTGVLTALYRMEYENWSIGEATRELRNNHYGDAACTTANDYLVEFLEIYQRGIRRIPSSSPIHAVLGLSWRFPLMLEHQRRKSITQP